MSALAISRPYAAAAFNVAKQTDTIEHWQTILSEMARIVAEIETVVRGGKLVENEAIAGVILDLLASKMTDSEKNFLQVLLENKRIFVLPAIVERFQQLLMEAQATVRVKVESAMPIDDIKTFEKFLVKKIGKKVDVSFEENSSLLGGVKIYINDDVVDASIAGRLKQLSTALR